MTDRTDDFRLIAAALPPQPRRGSPHPPKVRAGLILLVTYCCRSLSVCAQTMPTCVTEHLSEMF